MHAGERQCVRLHTPGVKHLKIGSAELREFRQKGCERATGIPVPMPKSIVGLEARVSPLRENDPRARNPVGLLSVDEVPNHIERTERVRPLVGAGPLVWKAVEKGVQRSRSASKDSGCAVESKLHVRLPSPDYWLGSPGFSSSTSIALGATSSRSRAGVPVSAGNVP